MLFMIILILAISCFQAQAIGSCCDELHVEGRYFANGDYTKIERKHHDRAVYMTESKKWCIFFARHWKIDSCDFLEPAGDWSQGYGWSKINAVCPEDIGLNWRYYSWDAAGSDSGPVDQSILIGCKSSGNIRYQLGNSLFATCDNVMKIYFDGVLQHQDDPDPSAVPYTWSKTTELVIPRGVQVLGIECLNQGYQKGILASTSDGLLTDGNWMCSGNQNLEGWAEPGFIDANGDFSAAINFSTNGVAPWGQRPNIAKDASWIWGDKTSNWAACRKIIGTSVYATCDNVMKIYFDGVLQYQDSDDPNLYPYAWSVTTELVIPRGTNVLGIECRDYGGSKGIIASLSDGQMTDETWTCSSNSNIVRWAEPQFEDLNGDFTAPTNIKLNKDGTGGLRPNISEDAQWIWGDRDSDSAVCRKTIDATEAECLSDVLMAAGNPACCQYKSVCQKFPKCCNSVLFGELRQCSPDVVVLGRKRRSTNLKRKKRRIGCGSSIRSICYCPRMMRRPNWTNRFPECCCHPVRKFMANHRFLYNDRCASLGVPRVG